MAAAFREAFRFVGVDEAMGKPGMIIPDGGANIVAIADGAGLTPRSDNSKIKFEKVDPNPILLARHVMQTLVFPDRLMAAINKPLIPSPLPPNTTFWKVSCNGLLGPNGAEARLTDDKTPLNQHLMIAVVRRKTFKLAIHPVQVRDASGGLVYHSKKPFDINNEVAQMNNIWTPQANVAFKLVSDDPVIIDDGEEIAKALDLKLTTKAPLPRVVNIARLRSVFRTRVDLKAADFTMFLVEQANDGDKDVEGVTQVDDAFALISDFRESPTMAHEAGHFIGRVFSKGKLIGGYPHQPEINSLMHDGGSYKVHGGYSNFQ